MLVERTDQEYRRLLRNTNRREEEYGKDYWVCCVEIGTGHEARVLESVMMMMMMMMMMTTTTMTAAATNISYTVCRYIHNLKPKIHVPRYK